MKDAIDQARHLATQSRHPVFFTGAGMSADSGIPTFRDAMTGLWARYAPTELATSDAFARDPELVWNFYEYRRGIVRNCVPNPGHRAIAAFEGAGRGVTVITQNVDGYHQFAGSRHVLCLHGNIMENRCHEGCPGVSLAVATSQEDRVPPVCPACGRRSIRPNVVWFGESLDEVVLQQATTAVQACDLLVVVGTSGVVYPAAGLVDLALRIRKPIIEINPEPTPWTEKVYLYLRGRAGELLAQMLPA